MYTLFSAISMMAFFTLLIASVVLAIKKRKGYRKTLIGIMVSLLVFCCGCSSQEMTAINKKSDNTASAASASGLNKSVSGKLKIHYIDVGQGDSILVQQDGRNMLIDTGTNASTDTLINYLHSQDIDKIDYLVLTHAHEDHIGGADAVIRDFDIGTIYMTKYTSSTKTFRDVISTMKSKGLKATLPVLGNKFNLGQASCTIMGPVNPQGEDLNTCSIVIKLTFGSTKFLFTGDAQASNEEAMINNKYDLSVDVLKVGHHGSHTSTCQQFLNAVNPKYAVISAGKGNDYGHPHKETMDRLKAKGVKVYRTDESGTIICTSDGKNISFSCKPGDYTCGSSGGTTMPKTSSGISGHTAGTSSGTISVSAVINNPSPAQNSTETLTVKGQAGAAFKAVCHYSSKDTIYNGTVGRPLSFGIGRAKKGYNVMIDITVTYNGKSYETQTSFTPQ